MSFEELQHYSKEQLIEELIHRRTFAGVVLFCRGDAKDGHLEEGDIVITKSPPLTQRGVEELLRLGQSLVPGLFGETAATAVERAHTTLPLHAVHPPLRVDDRGAVRVGKSRIALDLIVAHHEDGMTPEDMVRAYDTLVLADVYAVIAYYLRHRNEVQDFLKQRREEAEALRKKIEAERPRVTREELLARRIAKEADHAATGK